METLIEKKGFRLKISQRKTEQCITKPQNDNNEWKKDSECGKNARFF